MMEGGEKQERENIGGGRERGGDDVEEEGDGIGDG